MSKVINLTHLARTRPLGLAAPSLVDRLRALFAPVDRRIEEYLRSIGALFAATYNYRGGVSGGKADGLVCSPGVVNVSSIKLDFAKIKEERTASGQAMLAATDVLELFGVPAGTWAVATFAQVVKAEGATATADVGDGTDAAGFITNANLNAVGWSHSLVTTPFSVAVGGGKLYTAADTVDLRLDHDNIDVAVVHLSLVSVDVRPTRQ